MAGRDRKWILCIFEVAPPFLVFFPIMSDDEVFMLNCWLLRIWRNVRQICSNFSQILSHNTKLFFSNNLVSPTESLLLLVIRWSNKLTDSSFGEIQKSTNKKSRLVSCGLLCNAATKYLRYPVFNCIQIYKFVSDM